MDNKKLITALNSRYATKLYAPDKKISPKDFEILLEVLRLAPSSFGLEPWKFIVAENKELRAKLKPAAWNQSPISDASHLIVICSMKEINEEYIKSFIERTAKTRKIKSEQLAEYEEMLLGFRAGKSKEFISEWTKRQAYIALGFLLEAASLKGIDATPMEGFDHVQFDNILGIDKSNYSSVVLCALGYRSKNDKYALLKKVRFNKNEVIEIK